MLFHWFYKDDLSADDSRPEELLELVERQTSEYVENNSSDFEEEFPALENEVNSRYMRLKRRNPAVLSYSEKNFCRITTVTEAKPSNRPIWDRCGRVFGIL